MDLPTRLAHPDSVGPQFFFGGNVFSEVDLPGKRKKKKSPHLVFGGATPSDPPAHSRSVEPQFFLAESFSKGSIYPESLKINFEKKKFFILPHSHSFLRTWLASKVRKCQKEALKAPGRHDSMRHPTPKFYDETLSWIYTSSQKFRSIRLLTPSKMLWLASEWVSC